MIKRWLSWLNCVLLGLALLVGLAGGFYWFTQPVEIACENLSSKNCGLPKGAFELEETAYQQVGDALLVLEYSAPTMQLPDLRQQLIYYGKNGRPDAQSEHLLLHFSLNGNNKVVMSIAPEEKLYLVYDGKSSSSRYSFSPNNEKTSLWIEGKLVDHEVQVQVKMENDQGEQILEPENFAQFRLTEKEFIRYAGATWEIGTFRVDGTLLARQKARWFGGDRFLEDHGGEDFKHVIGSQRIDFGENDDLYSVFVKIGDCLIWNQDVNQWKVVPPGKDSLGHPLLVIKKIDERLMAFELWDVEGKGKIGLNLLKSSEPWPVQNAQALQHMFKFLGARTKTQCVFEVNRERVILKPSDWLLLTSKGWKKLETEEEIDLYVKRKLLGTLFVFEGLSRKDERQIMLGKLYSPTRHECQTIELALLVGKSKTSNPKDVKNRQDKEKAEAIERLAPLTRTSETMNLKASPPSPSKANK